MLHAVRINGIQLWKKKYNLPTHLKLKARIYREVSLIDIYSLSQLVAL
ncbi:hypothetical protein XBO1_2640013 [Xenorhabdus bovienii str. oregonense]|uniref:Uncharacterized protein n=1 Tax=Xenorhabdus bovienii str. oregonense TaxID=1398202 RepID=A0A077PCC4_XENBV|nr:hypothetical protein XBO1_2640013 [Xenorhabdus bovienii str. oregonense]